MYDDVFLFFFGLLAGPVRLPIQAITLRTVSFYVYFSKKEKKECCFNAEVIIVIVRIKYNSRLFGYNLATSKS